MRVQIITNLFAPDELAGASLFTDLALFLKEQGHDVRVTSTFSYYPAWKLKPEDQGVSLREESYAGMPVRRLGMFVPQRPTGKGRMLSDLSFLLALLRRAAYRDWEPDVVLTAIPMLSQCLAQRFLYWGKKIPRVIVVQDFVVEAALELGILRLPGFERLLHGVQRWSLRSAQTLVTISPMMLDKLRGVVGPDRRACYVPNWIHRSLQMEIDRQSSTVTARQSCTLFYAGNLGVKQGLPDFLKQFRAAAAANLGWRLRIHGGGADRDRLAKEVEQTPGCELGPVLSEAEYVTALRQTAACLVTQCPGVGSNFLPSKLLPALASGTPVLAVCEASSPLGREVIEGSFGEVVDPGNPVKLTQTLKRWSQMFHLLSEMQTHANLRAGMFKRDRILALYENELLALADPKDTRRIQQPQELGADFECGVSAHVHGKSS
jgi:colanic acid biosynthesis glycosyl transferase WcaI